MKRVKINSRTSNVHVSLSYPTIDPNRTYVLTVEKLTVPAMDSLILNESLFTVERRLEGGINDNDITVRLLPIDPKYTTFTPQNVRTVSQLLYQMNTFFQELCLRCVSTGLQYDVQDHQYAIPGNFATQAEDWNNLQHADVIKQGLMAILRPDGKIGFYFSNDGVKLFVLKLTDRGKTLLGETKPYIAVDENGLFSDTYNVELNLVLVPPELDVSDVDLPGALDEGGYSHLLPHNMFSHTQYRHELVLTTSLPLENTVECDTDRSFYKRQLASYRFPDSDVRLQYDSEPTVYEDYASRYLCEKFQTMYAFEENLTTHNKFVLRGTSLQNFHLYLVTRNYERQADKSFKQVDRPYDMFDESFFTVQMAVKQLNV